MNRHFELLKTRLPEERDPRREWLMRGILGLLVVIVLWSLFFTIEEQIRTSGTVIVSSRSQLIQIVDSGTLQKLHVQEGDVVEKGQLLASLDPTRYQASNDEIAAKAASLRANIERLEAELSGLPLQFSDSVKAYPDLVRTQQALAAKRRQAQQEELAAIAQSRQLAQQELDANQRALKTGDVGQMDVIRAQRQVSDLQAQYTNKRNGFRQEAQTEMTKNRAELDQTMEVLTQRNEAVLSTSVRSPMAGVVKNIRYTTLGAVLKSGDELMQIVPSNEPMIVEARVPPKDVGFLRSAMQANVKLDAYDYTRYGMLKGQVTYISADTLSENLKQGEAPYYRVHIQTNDPVGRLASLEIRPGMTAVVEIITGDRSVASFVAKPLRRGFNEAMHER